MCTYLRVVDRRLEAFPAQVYLPAAGLVIALRAADEAALGIVEARLAVVAVGGGLARDVRAVLVRGPVLPEPQRSEQKHEERGRGR